MNHLQERRQALGLTQPQVSAKLREVDPRYDVGMVSRLENGVCLPSPKVLIALEDTLQASQAELYGDDELSVMEAIAATEPLPEPSPEIEELVDLIYVGKSGGVSREYLSANLGVSDREVRSRIAEARRLGFTILNDQDGRGYYLSDDPDEWERQFRQDTNRALSILARRKTIRARLIAAGRKV